MQTTLVLDHCYVPLQPVPWTTAIVAVVQGHAEILESYAGKFIRSATQSWPFPAVIRLVKAFRRKDRAHVKYTPENVFARDGYKCAFCGAEDEPRNLTRDHVIPRSHGGKTDWLNTVTSCRPCNNRKADRTPAQAGMPLLFLPTKPKWLPPRAGRVRGSLPEEWKAFV
jgi:5-methylcytosine-specific restriction endonuclease McrA